MANSTANLIVVLSIVFAVSVCVAREPVDFKNDVVPVLTKSGCNAGACHGAALGRGGFKLSLYGGNPEADYVAIVMELEGRRINLASPDSSLLLLKPTETISHDGGFRFDFGDESAERILQWIEQGASLKTHRTLDRVDITPNRIVTMVGKSTSIKATAHYSDGSVRDVTQWTIFKAEDPSAVAIDDEASEAEVLRRGRHIVVARYLDQVIPIELIAPLTDADVDLASEPRKNFVDDEVLASLESLRLPVSPLVDDVTFVRRATLDLTGRLPTPDRVRGILALPEPLDRAEFLDELLTSEAFTEYWTLQFAKLLRLRVPRGADAAGAKAYHRWLADQVHNDVGYDEIARQLLLAIGNTRDVGPANFYRSVDGAREQAELVSELFMGSRLRCANCHNHPLDRWTQDDYHGLAAIFAKLEAREVVGINPRGQVIHPRTLEAAIAKIPGESEFLQSDEASDDSNDVRSALADWLTDKSNSYFAKAIVNRLWKSMMGRGLVEPADDFRATNPATHPRLLNKLAEDFVEHGYRVRHTLRRIASSTTYARSANATLQNKDDDRFYSHRIREALQPEVLADAISDVLGVHEEYGSQPQGTRAVTLVNPKTPSQSLDVLGRCGRESSCEAAPVAGGLPQKLHLLNGELLNARLRDSNGRLQRLLAAKESVREIVEEFYVAGLGRKPTKTEESFWMTKLSALKTNEEQVAFLEDFVWGLLTSSEFVTNH